MKENFKCPKCKQRIKVGKQLHSSYKCPHCHYQFLISREERLQGYCNYKRNFMLDAKR